MHYKLAACDDPAADLQYIQSLAGRWAARRGHTVHVEAFPSAEALLFQWEERKDYDILLLDIELGGMDGVTMARTLRRDNDGAQIVFITGYGDYIAQGYEVAALHYLMKPVGEEKLFTVLDRAAERLAKNERALLLESGGGLVRLPLYQIRWAEVSGNYVTVHAAVAVTARMTLGELEKRLDERFYRIGRSAIVNLTEIRRVTKTELRLADGAVLPLPRGAYEGVERAIIRYI